MMPIQLPWPKHLTKMQAMDIMAKFKKGGHIDPDLFDVFVKQGVYRRYAEHFLDAAQIDVVDEATLTA